MLQSIRSLLWTTGVDIMPGILTSNVLAKWSSIFHFGSSRCYEIEGIPKRFGRKPQHLLGRRSHLRKEQLRPVRWHVDDRQFMRKEVWRCGAPWSAFGRVSRCCLSWLSGCARLILAVVSWFTSYLIDWFACLEIFWYKSFREDVAINQIAALNNRCWYHAGNFDFQCTCQVEQYFPFWIISMLWNWRYPQTLWQKTTAFARPQEPFA